MKHLHEIRDPIHTFLRLDRDELRVLASPPVQRLRHIHQLALTFLVYPGATHKRFEHSLGVMELATRIFDSVMRPDRVCGSPIADLVPVQDELRYWRRVLRVAALCHDIGHLPFSHAAEAELLPEGWDHERLTIELIRSDELESIWAELRPPLRSSDIIKIAVGPTKAPTELTEWETILSEMIVGDAFGADRIDYLLRDSLHSGVAYGRFDHHRLIDTLRILPRGVDGSVEPMLGVEDGGLHSVEALLLARYFMYTQVYFHPVRRAYDFHLQEFLREWRGPNGLPTDVHEHLLLTDHEVYAAMLSAERTCGSKGHIPAKRIIQRNHYREIYRRNPQDIGGHPEAADLLASGLREEFGSNAVYHYTYKDTGGALDFPVLMPDGRVESSIMHSDLLRTFPAMAVDYIFVEAGLRNEASAWLGDNRRRIIAASETGDEANGET